MPDLLSKLPATFTFSQSSLQDYVDCPRRFQLRYIEQLHWPAVETGPVLENERHQREGQLFHRMVQQHLIGMPVDNISRSASQPILRRWWENYLNHNLDINGQARFLELGLSAPFGEHRLLAKYDLVVVKRGVNSSVDDKVVIVDWKTSYKRPRNEWMATRLQTHVYRYLMVVAGAELLVGKSCQPEQVEMIYWYADFPKEPAHFPYDPSLFRRDASALDKLVSEISSTSAFPLTTEDVKCRFCLYRSYCGRGIEAGNWQDTEIEIDPEEIGFDINLEQVGEIEF